MMRCWGTALLVHGMAFVAGAVEAAANVTVLPAGGDVAACPMLVCDAPDEATCTISSPITFACPTIPLQCVWTSTTDIILNAPVTMRTNSICDVELVWNISGSATFTENVTMAVTSLYLYAKEFQMYGDGVIFAEHNMTFSIKNQLRIDQDSSLVSGGEEAGKSGGSINMTASSLILHGTIKASGGDGQCDETSCIAGGTGGQVTLIYESIAEEIGHIYISGGNNPLTLSSLVASYAGSRDDLDESAVLPQCLTGSAGRLLRIHKTDNGTREGVLLISNTFNSRDNFKDLLPLSKVRCAILPLTLADIDPSVKSVMLESEALVHFEHTDTWDFLGDTELLLEDATFVVKSNNTLKLNLKQLVVRGTSTFVAPHGLNVSAAIISIDYGAQVHLGYSATSTFYATDGIHIDGNITSNIAAAVWTNTDPTGQLILQSRKDLVISGFVSMPTVYASARSNLIVSGELESRKRMNKTDPVEYQLCSSIQTAESILNNYTISLFSDGVITLGEENKPGALTGAALLLCADNALTVSTKFQLSSSGFGYPANHGYGHGECVDDLGSGGGYGGNGADSYTTKPTKSLMAIGGHSYGPRLSTGLLGSGGGCESAGAGGGVIVLGAHHLNLNGTIAADGVNGDDGAGGGSGGYVSIVVPNGLSGHGLLSASGGNVTCVEEKITFNTSQIRCGGGGGGGQLRLQGCINFTECASAFSGEYYVDGGHILSRVKLPNAPVGSTGTYFGFPCPPGYGGFLCRACPAGTFKEERGSVECIPCHNAPPNSHYRTTGSTTSECLWTCDPGYTGQHCLSPLDDLFELMGGRLVVAVMAILLLLVIVGVGYYFKRDPYVKYRPGESDHLLIIPKPKRPWYSLHCCRFSRWLWPRVGYPKLEGNDLKFHMIRLYLSGDNSQSNPLLLRATVESAHEEVFRKEEFERFAQDINKTLAFSTSGSIFYKFVQCFCYPFASDVLLLRRHKKFNALKRYFSKYQHLCMKGTRSRTMMNSIKLGYAADYSLVYIEFLHNEYRVTNCVPTDGTPIGKPHLPIVLLFAGMGSYESPLYLDPNDLMVRSLPLAPELDAFIDDQWIDIVAELNARLRIVDTSNDAKCAGQLQAVAEYCEDMGDLQTLGGLRLYLGMFYTHNDIKFGYKWGIYLTTAKHVAEKIPESQKMMKPDLRMTNYSSMSYPQHDQMMKSASQSQNILSISSIRNAALLSPRSLAQTAPPPRSTFKPSKASIPPFVRMADFSGQLDHNLPVPGVLLTSAEFQQYKIHFLEKEKLPFYYRLWSLIMPANVTKPPDTKFHGWGVFLALIVLVILDLVTALGMLVNLKCVENGEEVVSCTKTVIYPVLFIYPLAILLSPVIGIISLAMGSASVARKYALWNSCSYLNVVVAIIICYLKSDKLVALYVTRPLPLLPVTLLLLKIGEARVVNIYIADIESNRRRRGWRGLMKRRDSDASSPPDSPYIVQDLKQAKSFIVPNYNMPAESTMSYGSLDSRSRRN